MKIKLTLISCLFLISVARSQILISLLLGDKLNSGNIEFGLDGGLNYSTIAGIDNTKYVPGFNLGFYFDIKIKNHPGWMLNTGVIVKSPLGAKGLDVYSLNNTSLDSSFVGGSVYRKLRYFNVPIMIKYTFKNNVYAKIGTQLGLMNHASDEFVNTVDDKEDLKYSKNIRDGYHPIDAGFAAGIGYRFMKGNGMNLGIQYYYGLVDITVDDSNKGEYNQSVYFNVGIPIGVGAAKKKDAEKK